MTKRGYRRVLGGTLLATAYLLLIGGIAAPTAVAQKETSITGVVGDDRCGNAHEQGTARACTLDCVKHRAANYALMVGQKAYTLQGKVAILESLAGQKATVTGFLRSDMFMVTSASPAP